MEAKYLECDGERIAYLKRPGRPPGIVWLGGFKSEMSGNKASAFDAWAERSGHSSVRFDYFGHGRSSGAFRDGTMTRWRDDALAVLDQLTNGPQVLIGSSMGGWIALMLALSKPERVAGLLLIAPAIDFTEALLRPSLSTEALAAIEEKGEWARPSQYSDEPYPITRRLLEDGRRHTLLGGASLAVDCPVRIVQGMKDPDVPWQHALKLAEALNGDVSLSLIKNGDHRLSNPPALRTLLRTLEGLIEEVASD